MTKENFTRIDPAFFLAGAEASLRLAPKAIRETAVAIGNPSAWRMDLSCPLDVPERGFAGLFCRKGIIANSNCSTRGGRVRTASDVRGVAAS